MLPVFMILRCKIYFMRAFARNTVFSKNLALLTDWGTPNACLSYSPPNPAFGREGGKRPYGTPRTRSVRNLLPYSGKAGTGRAGAPQCAASNSP